MGTLAGGAIWPAGLVQTIYKNVLEMAGVSQSVAVAPQQIRDQASPKRCPREPRPLRQQDPGALPRARRAKYTTRLLSAIRGLGTTHYLSAHPTLQCRGLYAMLLQRAIPSPSCRVRCC